MRQVEPSPTAVRDRGSLATSDRPVPMLLDANQPPRFYRGGAEIARLRGRTVPGDGAATWTPEDWVASTTTLFGEPEAGLSRLPNGRLLRDAVHADPTGWLGPEHTAEFGADPALLVKLLDAGQRLPVHCHPSNEFARTHLGCRYGKTEAWVVIGTRGPDPTVRLGFRQDVSADQLRSWVAAQDRTAMLAALNTVHVRPGDTVLVPAGMPHAIGEGVFLVELQQPTDLTVLLEREGFSGPEGWHLGLGADTALTCVDRSGWDYPRLSGLLRSTSQYHRPFVNLLPETAAPFFRADRLHPEPEVELEPSFAVLVGLEGTGALRTEHGDELPVQRGSTVVVPHGAGVCRLIGDVVAVRCRPPAVHPDRKDGR